MTEKMISSLTEETITYLKEVANDLTCSEIEDFDPTNSCGGSDDEDYKLGIDEGKIILAKEILRRMGIKY